MRVVAMIHPEGQGRETAGRQTGLEQAISSIDAPPGANRLF
jgi:hypothetical protein